MHDSHAAGLESEVAAHLMQSAAERGRPIATLDAHVEFFDSGILDSLSLVDFVTFLERRYDITIPGADISPENLGSLSAVVQYLQRRLAPDAR